jgi:hypothetical protein
VVNTFPGQGAPLAGFFIEADALLAQSLGKSIGPIVRHFIKDSTPASAPGAFFCK